MFCHNCGKEHADDAAFCGNCGTPLTPAAPAAHQAAPAAPQYTQAAPAAPQYTQAAPQPTPATPVAPQPTEPQGPNFFTKLLDVLKGYIKTPKTAAAEAAAQKEGLGIAGIFAGLNFLMLFFLLWRFVGLWVTSMADNADVKVTDMIDMLKLEYPILPLLVAAMLITPMCIALTALVVFLVAKLNKKEADLKTLLVTESVNTLIPSALLLTGILLSFVAWWFIPVVLGLILVLWFVGVLNAIGQSADDSKSLLINTGVIAAALLTIVLLGSVITNWSIGETVVRNESLNEQWEENEKAHWHTMIDTMIVD